MLELLWLGIVVPLERELLREAVPEPDVEVDHVVPAPSVHLAGGEQVSAQKVTMHQSPGVLVHFAIDDLGDCLSNLSSRSSYCIT